MGLKLQIGQNLKLTILQRRCKDDDPCRMYGSVLGGGGGAGGGSTSRDDHSCST